MAVTGGIAARVVGCVGARGFTGARVVGRRHCIAVFDGGRKAFIEAGCVYGCNTSESIIMTRRPPTTKICIVLRTILSVGVLAVLLVLACTGTAAGATWVVDDDGGGADFTSIRAEAGAGPIPIHQTEKITHALESISTGEVTSSEYNYVSHIFTVADVIFFSLWKGSIHRLPKRVNT